MLTECCGNPLRNGGCGECPPKKLTFDDFWNSVLMPTDDFDMSRFREYFEDTWKAAQENK